MSSKREMNNAICREGRTAPVLIICLLASACGGGGGSGSDNTGPPPPNPPPPPSTLTHCEGSERASFENVSTRLGLCYDAAENNPIKGGQDAHLTGGLAFADIDRDGQLELYVAHGDNAKGRLFSFNGTSFTELEGRNGIDPSNVDRAGYFADLDADGWPDFVSIQDASVEIFVNDQTGQFTKSEDSGILIDRSSLSMAAADVDRDQDLDLFFAHHGSDWPSSRTQYFWRNLGAGQFKDDSDLVPVAPGVSTSDSSRSESLYSAVFSDLGDNGYSDLLLVGDQRSTRVLRNEDGAYFRNITDTDVRHDFGRGTALGDYDLDGDFDWFVTGVHEADSDERIGNRLYENRGRGEFRDVTDGAGVARGGFAWGTCFADFDNDRHLDLFLVSGSEQGSDNAAEPARLYMSNGDGSFTEKAADLGVRHSGEGRGLVCTDYDRDGKLDIFIANHGQSPKVYRNVQHLDNHYLGIDLVAGDGNRGAVGGVVKVTTASGTQVREVRLGSTYLSQSPLTLHFGLGSDAHVDSVEVVWPGPGRRTTLLEELSTNQYLVIEQPDPEPLALVVVRGSGRGLYLPGDSVSIEAGEGPEGYVFSHWSSSAGGEFADRLSPSTSFTMPYEAVTIRANFLPTASFGDENISVARIWNEVLLEAIRNDFARPVVHARNLFHISAAMYDAWAAFDTSASTYFYGKEFNQGECEPVLGTRPISDKKRAQEVSLSYAAYRLIRHRFKRSPGSLGIVDNAKTLMNAVDLDPGFDLGDLQNTVTEENYAAWIGNYIAGCYILLGTLDRSNEGEDYANKFYEPINPALEPHLPGNPNILNLNRWQPLRLQEFVDQAHNPSESEPAFIGAEWGAVRPFALPETDLQVFSRDAQDYWVYHDPGPPPTIDGAQSDLYKWGFSLVAKWASHLDPSDGVEIDISPRSIGNIETYPREFEDFAEFYADEGGSRNSRGHRMNPVTGQAYQAQMKPRGDYSRVLAEFWADGPDSETPPGHWFVILNHVQDHADFERRFKGLGDVLDTLEWDIKAYFALGGAMHDAAIAAWGAKGWYDYVRPISALRAMADRGQSSDERRPSFDDMGITLDPGYIELVAEGDPLAGENGEHVGKIKFLSWRGPDYIDDAGEDAAGVGWILAENWWPYQRPTFVTPPFAGYVSGHSTYSRAAAEVLTLFTGSAFFPGGKSEFEIPAGDFLVFERGPSVDLTLEWATYRDAADQSALSRIWGGIHPPIDDLPGRLMGEQVGKDAFTLAEEYFDGVR